MLREWCANGLVLAAIGCGSSPPAEGTPRGQAHLEEAVPVETALNRPDHVYAFYNDDNLLTTDTFAQIDELLARNCGEPYTDVYVVSHGWNFTLSGALANYESYLDAVARVMTLSAPNRSFKPLLVFVCWSSVTRPAQEAARSLLPFALDEAIAIPTSLIDGIVFHLPSMWKQSLNAAANALGRNYPDDYLADTRDRSSVISRSFDGSAKGFDVPTSAMLHRLMVRNEAGELGAGEPVRLHCVGHSFGAKLLLLASMESLRRFEHTHHRIGRGIESLTLFNAAMHPSEASYRTHGIGDTPMSEKSPDELLSRIPRKAFIYSNSDFTLGLTFEFSQLVINNMHAQRGQQVANAFVEDRRGSRYQQYWFPAYILRGALQFGWSSLVGVTMWTTRRIVNLPQDLIHHVENSSFLSNQQNGFGSIARGLHYFLPIGWIYAGDSDQQGFFRASTGGLGKSGLARHAAGREFELTPWGSVSYSNTEPLTRFARRGDDVSTNEYARLASRRVDPSECRYSDPLSFYSFDASTVLQSLRPFVGSHGMLREESEIVIEGEDGPVKTRVIDSTVQFVLNFSHGESVTR